MSTNVFLVWAPELTVPLTIYAPTADEAAETFALWCSIHQPYWSREPERIEEVSDEWLQDRPQLAQAVNRARRDEKHDAIMWFHSHDGGWFAIDVHEQINVGGIAPIEPRVRAFSVKVEIDGREDLNLAVFAFTPEDALQMFFDFREVYDIPASCQVTVTEFSRWLLTGARTQLRKLMDMGVTGVAGWTNTGGWGIYPATHDHAGGD